VVSHTGASSDGKPQCLYSYSTARLKLVHPRTNYECPEWESSYRSTLSLTSVINGVGGQLHVPAALPPQKTRYLLYRRLGGPQGRSGRVRKISRPPGFDPRAAQPVASRYIELSYPGPHCAS